MPKGDDAKAGSGWAKQLAIATIPALVTAWFGYETALVQANANTRDRTDAAYDTLKEAVDGLGGNVKQDQENFDALRARILDLEHRINALHGPAGATPAPISLKSAMLFRPLPPTLDK